MALLSTEQIQTARMFIFQHGRLLERQMFEYLFGSGTKQACLRALRAYQNEDGGFGNGIEPDIACPDSSAIGAETAMFYLEMLDCQDGEMVDGLVGWILANQNGDGFINHPPAHFLQYPYQPWWKNPDNARILSLAGLMGKWGIHPAGFSERVRRFFLKEGFPPEVRFYDYPYFVYLKYCGVDEVDRAQFSIMVDGIPALLTNSRDHFPLFNRAWYHAAEYVDKQVLDQEAAFFVSAIHADGNIDSPYPQFPSWNPIFLLDGLMLLRKAGYL
jgi:hypothetical protein